jgi:glycosyltransferase involved in cell wall biosynthesis
MIVKDEAEVIRRALEPIKTLIDHWVIVDTGSTDSTREIIREALASLPGQLHDRPWKNFGHNRSEAIALARDKADYLLFFDADDVLQLSPGFQWPELSADAYLANFTNASRSYKRIVLVANRLPWRYEGVIHEYPTPDCTFSEGQLPGLVVESRRDGARGKLGQREKYSRDAKMLAAELAEDPSNTRNAFYLAMSHKDADELEDALAAFERRAAMGGWDEEVWFSLLQIAELKARLEHDEASVIAAFLAAHQARPTRAEALGMLARRCRVEGKRWALARLFAREASALAVPDDRLFLDRSWYEWQCLDEFAVASYWCGDFNSARDANLQLLMSSTLPEAQRARVRDNLAHCERKLAPPQPAARPGPAS